VILSFIIPVRDDAARLARCLRSIAANDRSAAQVRTVVADNGSSDGSADVARSAGATVLSLPSLRVSALRNRAAAAAAGDILAFVDADHEIAPTWITAAADVFNDPHVAATGALYTPPPDGTWTQRMFGVLRGRTIGHSDAAWLGSGNLAVRREVFEQVRGFDETLETCEDVDLCQRIRQAGHRVVADERLASIHSGDPKSLRELFLSERWRGRDNIRVSLRSGLGLRDLPSVVIPVIDAVALAGLVLVLAEAAVVGSTSVLTATVAVAVVGGLAALRAVRMCASGGLSTPVEWAQAYAVALTYDVARACSLFWPAGHRRTRAK
jgi:GT2 family glycosyltransferase